MPVIPLRPPRHCRPFNSETSASGQTKTPSSRPFGRMDARIVALKSMTAKGILHGPAQSCPCDGEELAQVVIPAFGLTRQGRRRQDQAGLAASRMNDIPCPTGGAGRGLTLRRAERANAG